MSDRPPLRAMDLGNMRQNGADSITLSCACGHEATVKVDHLPDHLEVPSVRLRYRCSKCGRRPRSSTPDWSTRGY